MKTLRFRSNGGTTRNWYTAVKASHKDWRPTYLSKLILARNQCLLPRTDEERSTRSRRGKTNANGKGQRRVAKKRGQAIRYDVLTRT